jgi:hypothetical protein
MGRLGLCTFLYNSDENVEHVFVEQIHKLPCLFNPNAAEQIESHHCVLQSGNGLMQKLHDYHRFVIWRLLYQELATAAISLRW